jgi:hypothetical protein
MFEHHNRIGAGWNRSAGHDLPGCAFKQGASWSLAGMGGASQLERRMRGGFSGAASEAVTRGAGERRLIAIGA